MQNEISLTISKNCHQYDDDDDDSFQPKNLAIAFYDVRKNTL